MKDMARWFGLFLIVVALGFQNPSPQESELTAEGLLQPVQLYRDPWGVTHIFALNQDDLFFAQGFNAARDRLFQLEMWRRAATGTMSEILGERAVTRDHGARLLRFRGDLGKEMRHYHPEGERIVNSFVKGINAYIDRVRKEDSARMPIEFGLLGIEPGHWTPEIVISRHNGLFRNVQDEVRLARLSSKVGREKLSRWLSLSPGRPELSGAEGDWSVELEESVLKLYRASRSGLDFLPEDIADEEWRGEPDLPKVAFRLPSWTAVPDVGSNNWVVGPRLAANKVGYMANDPHRAQQIPSLRYFVHLSAPGWNVIGGGEPALPGVSIGHNEVGAWGLTIFAIDQEDIYVYETHPDDPLLYRHDETWQRMREERETIPVKNAAPREVLLRFTRHGPVLFEDRENHRAFALRAAWLEVGTAPYLASLRFDQAGSWEEFRKACDYFLAPSENMVWADRAGNIGWQATGIAPIRRNWTGLLPVPGDGRFEWDGFLPVGSLPRRFNPAEGFLATANQNNLPDAYPHSVGFQWAEPFRYRRIQEVLGSGRVLTLSDMTDLQNDKLSILARSLVPLLRGLEPEEEKTRRVAGLLLGWDFRLEESSEAAAAYMMWERRLYENTWDLHLPEEIREEFNRKSWERALDWLMSPGPEFGVDPVAGRDRLLLRSLREAVDELERRFGQTTDQWRWGDPGLHHIGIEHPLSAGVRTERRAFLDLGPVPRGGSGRTVDMTNDADRQTSGASFRVIVDLEDWDRSLGVNNPGQSGDPNSAHYRDLVEMWRHGKYFPLYFSRDRIEEAAEDVVRLRPEEE